MRANRHIVLNAGRVGQIEKLAKLRETTIAGTVEALVADRVTAGEIPAGFDGFRVDRQGETICIVLVGSVLAPIPATDAAQLGCDLEDLAGKMAGAITLKLPDGVELKTKRNGPGWTISAGAVRYNVSGAMLREIAAQLGEIAR